MISREFHTMTQGELNMPLRKVRRFYQVSLPAKLSKKFGIAEGDYVEMEAVAEGILVKPVTVTKRVPAAHLTPREQQLLEKARAKIEQISVDITSAKGLTKAEARVAAKAGLIDPEQAWWWLESWQKGEREAEEDIRSGRMSGPFESVEEFKRTVKAHTPRS
jgi:AbrB family looped-hinge helix DNA binding protein